MYWYFDLRLFNFHLPMAHIFNKQICDSKTIIATILGTDNLIQATETPLFYWDLSTRIL